MHTVEAIPEGEGQTLRLGASMKGASGNEEVLIGARHGA